MRKFPFGPDELDQFQRSFTKVLKMSEDMFNSINKWMLKEGPRAEVFDKEKYVLIQIEAPGLGGDQIAKWAYRTSGHHFYVRGTLDVRHSVRDALGSYYSERKNERFTKYIPLPTPITNRVRSVRCKNGLLCLEFKKSSVGGDGIWHEIQI